MIMYGIDVSRYQANLDWEVAAQENDFAIIKASEGRESAEYFFAQADLAKENGFLMGAYHYARPDWYGAPDAAEAEAIKFYDMMQTANLIGTAIPFLDWEVGGYKNGEQWINKFCDKFYELSGVLPWIYGSFYFLLDLPEVISKYNIWIAWYNQEKFHPGLKMPPKDQIDWQIWQYTGEYKIDGVVVDRNYTDMTPEVWKRYAQSDKMCDMTSALQNLGIMPVGKCLADPITYADLATIIEKLKK